MMLLRRRSSSWYRYTNGNEGSTYWSCIGLYYDKNGKPANYTSTTTTISTPLTEWNINPSTIPEFWDSKSKDILDSYELWRPLGISVIVICLSVMSVYMYRQFKKRQRRERERYSVISISTRSPTKQDDRNYDNFTAECEEIKDRSISSTYANEYIEIIGIVKDDEGYLDPTLPIDMNGYSYATSEIIENISDPNGYVEPSHCGRSKTERRDSMCDDATVLEYVENSTTSFSEHAAIMTNSHVPLDSPDTKDNDCDYIEPLCTVDNCDNYLTPIC